MKKYILSILTLVSIQALSQEVLVSHPSYPTSHLTMNGDVRGFHLPNVTLEDVNSITPFENITQGLMVYNTNPDVISGNGVGIYIYIGNKWIRSGENADHYLIKDYKQKTSVDYGSRNILNPREVVTISGKTFTKQGDCEQRSSEEYFRKYCLYTTTSSVNWEEAYALSRHTDIDGYLPVVTTEFEQENLETYLNNKSITSNIWMGIRKVNHRNNNNQENTFFTPYYYNMIGQTAGINWSNRPKKFDNFLALEPNNDNRAEGCVLMLGAGLGISTSGVTLQKNKWLDVSCTLTNFPDTNTGNINNVIVEIGY